MYQIILSQNAKKFLKKLNKQISNRIIKTIERLRFRPEAHSTKLIGQKIYKLRSGDYRIIFSINKGILQILIIKIDHRKKIYKR